MLRKYVCYTISLYCLHNRSLPRASCFIGASSTPSRPHSVSTAQQYDTVHCFFLLSDKTGVFKKIAFRSAHLLIFKTFIDHPSHCSHLGSWRVLQSASQFGLMKIQNYVYCIPNFSRLNNRVRWQAFGCNCFMIAT